LQLCIFRLLYSIKRISAAIGDTSFDRYTPHWLPNTALVLLFTLCHFWSRSNPTLLQFYIYSHQYSTGRISVSIGHMSTIRSSLYLKFVQICYTFKFVRAMSTLGLVKYTIIVVLHIPASISIWMYLRMLLVICLQYVYRCAFYSKFSAKYSTRQPVCSMSTLCPVKSIVITVLHIYSLVFN
jgi:hypothetical protein